MPGMRRRGERPLLGIRDLACRLDLLPALAVVRAAEEVWRLSAGVQRKLTVPACAAQRENVIDADAFTTLLPSLPFVGAEVQAPAMNAGKKTAARGLIQQGADV